MEINFYISQTEKAKFATACEAVLSRVGNGTKAAATHACETIKAASLAQVPRDTGTLASTFWYSVEADYQKGFAGSMTVSNNRYVAYLGYAGAGRETKRVEKALELDRDKPKAMYPEPEVRSYTTMFKKLQGAHYPGGNTKQPRRYNTKVKQYRPVGMVAGHGVHDAINPKSGVAASSYAAIVHEDLGMSHPRGGKAKFLEDPIRDYAAANFAYTMAHYWKYAIEDYVFVTERGKFLANYTEKQYFETKEVRSGDVTHKGDTPWGSGV